MNGGKLHAHEKKDDVEGGNAFDDPLEAGHGVIVILGSSLCVSRPREGEGTGRMSLILKKDNERR
jgi:hypothetical protein